MKSNIINENSDTITKYFKEVRESSLLTIDEEIELLNKIQNGDKNAGDELVKSNLKFVISVAKEYQGLGLSLSDLISDGNYGLVKSVDRFDPTRGFRFISYAVYWIKQSIIQGLNDNSRTIRLPTNVINELNKLNKLNDEFNEGDGKVYPTCVSLSDTLSTNTNKTISDYFFDDSADDSLDVELNKLKRAITNTLSILSKRERDIIECYFGLDTECEPMTLEAIGDKHKLTKERVRQIKEKGLRRLRHNNDELYLLLNH